MDCNSCEKKSGKAERFSDESMSEKLLRVVKWLLIAFAIFAVLNNAVWLYVWQMYDYSGDYSETVTVDGKEGVAGYVDGGGRMIVNGEGYSDETENPN